MCLCLKALNSLKDKIRVHDFENFEEEIHVFKHVKTELKAKLIYFKTLHSLESEKLLGSSEFLEKTLTEIKSFKESNKELYLYYKTESTYHDSIYFVRLKLENTLLFNDQTIEMDSRTNTSHVNIFAKFKAYDLLLSEILPLTEENEKINFPKLKWTHSKIALVELIYAIAASKTVNEGKASIKDLTKAFSILFDFELKDVYRDFIALKNRNDSDAYLRLLSDALNSRIEEEFEL